MADIETLTEDERALLEEMAEHYVGYSANEDAQRKALRIIDAQAARIAEVEGQVYLLREEREQHISEIVALGGQIEGLKQAHARARQRISELEAQVLSADTVSKAEYAAMVQQRDTLRQERNAARDQAEALQCRIEELDTPKRVWVAFVGEYADRRTLGVFASEQDAATASQAHYEARAQNWEKLHAPDLAARDRKETPDVEEWEIAGHEEG